MKRREILTGITLAAGGFVFGRQVGGNRAMQSSTLAQNDREAQILDVLERMQVEGGTYLAVPPQDGRWLRVLTEAAHAQSVVEVGTSTGYSGLWIALALAGTGGHLSTFEIDPQRAETAQGRFLQAGVANRVTVVIGDAHEEIRPRVGVIDVVFIDADKEGYPDYLEQLEPRVRPGGLILAHNVTSSRKYLESVMSDPRLDTVFPAGGNGLAVTLKKI